MEDLKIKIEILSKLIEENTKTLKLVHIKLFNQEQRLEALINKVKDTTITKECCTCTWEELHISESPCNQCQNKNKWQEKEGEDEENTCTNCKYSKLDMCKKPCDTCDGFTLWEEK